MWKGNTKVIPFIFITIIAILTLSMLPFFSAGEDAKIKIAVSISDFAPIAREIGGDFVEVRYILPPAMDPHSFSLTKEKIDEIKNADLIILANSNLLSYESKIKEIYGDKECLDFPDYEKEGASLATFDGFEKNPHGYWLGCDNAIAIAKTIAKKLSEMTGNNEYFMEKFNGFREKMEKARNCVINESIVAGIYGKKVVAAVPGVCYIASNYGIDANEILLSEGSASISIEERKKIEGELQSEDYIGIVIPKFMKYSKAGEIAEDIARETESRVIYVKFAMGGNESYESIFYYNFMQFLNPVEIEEKKYNGEIIILCVALTIFALFEGGIIYVLWRR